MKKPQQTRRRQQAQQCRAVKRRQRTKVHCDLDAIVQAKSEHELIIRQRLGTGVEGLFHYAWVLMNSGRFQDADRVLREVKRHAPLHHQIRAYRAAVRALAGDFSGAVWCDLRRTYWPTLCRKFHPTPLWDSTPHADGVLLVWDSLSGFGDLFQLCRLLAPAKRQFQGRVVFGIPAGMAPLLRSLRGPDACLRWPKRL